MSRKSLRILQTTAETGENSPTVITRSGRVVTPNKRHQDREYLFSSTKRTAKSRERANENGSCTPEESGDSMEDADENDENKIKHPSTALFDDAYDVAGGDIYAFHTPKKRDGMKLKAENTPGTKAANAFESLSLSSPRTSNTPKTPKGNQLQLLRAQHNLNTPRETRAKNSKEIKKRIQPVSDSESSADEHSDYDPDQTMESDQSSSEQDDSTNESDEAKPSHKDNRKVPPLKLTKISKSVATKTPTGMVTRGRTRGNKLQEDLILDSDNYFIAASNKKSKTSDHTLDQLKSSRLQHDELFSLLNSIHSSEEHDFRIGEMFQDLKTNFYRWMLEMLKGYNIIVYGCGSKQQLMHSFCTEYLADKPLIVVNGFFPSLTIKDILHAIKVDLLEISTNSRNDHEIVDLIASTLDGMPNGHIFLVINNIDGVMLRKTKDQHIISRLAKIKNVHLIASIDHINAPLMWDQTCMDNFNFVWYDCTTMLPYKNETAFENSVFFQNSGELDLAAMSNVFRSLTTNARGIYMLLVKNQIANQKDSNYQGMTFKDLYHKCRESFLVSSDSTLRTQLIEFVDHNMAKIKRSHDGTELVSIPINTQILSQFTQQQNE